METLHQSKSIRVLPPSEYYCNNGNLLPSNQRGSERDGTHLCLPSADRRSILLPGVFFDWSDRGSRNWRSEVLVLLYLQTTNSVVQVPENNIVWFCLYVCISTIKPRILTHIRLRDIPNRTLNKFYRDLQCKKETDDFLRIHWGVTLCHCINEKTF